MGGWAADISILNYKKGRIWLEFIFKLFYNIAHSQYSQFRKINQIDFLPKFVNGYPYSIIL